MEKKLQQGKLAFKIDSEIKNLFDKDILIKNSKSVDCRRILRKDFGIKDVRKFLLKEQDNKCAICGKRFDLRKTSVLKKSTRGYFKNYSLNYSSGYVLDHDHKTNLVRGVLCGSCNRGLGYFKDKMRFLKSAVEYLKKHGE